MTLPALASPSHSSLRHQRLNGQTASRSPENSPDVVSLFGQSVAGQDFQSHSYMKAGCTFGFGADFQSLLEQFSFQKGCRLDESRCSLIGSF